MTNCPVGEDLLKNERAAWDSHKILIAQKRSQEEIDQRVLLANKISADLRTHLETCPMCRGTNG
jgi:hypothetical protein